MLKSSEIIAVTQATIHPDDGELLALEYFLRCYTGPKGETLYGIRIDMRYPGGDLILRDETKPLSGSIADSAAFAEVLAAGTVTPYVLHDMILEWFCPTAKKYCRSHI
ncbi:MAG: DUF6514 family protein [Defluviitaleaceae bacterium]|nr:DUF6514 family protein [Defluviitaleaceae bacterium]